MSSNNTKFFENIGKQNNNNKKEKYKQDQHHKNIFNKINENIRDINPPQKLNKINSFICLSIPKRKQLSKNILGYKNKSEDIENKEIYYYNIFSFMKSKEEKSKKKS